MELGFITPSTIKHPLPGVVLLLSVSCSGIGTRLSALPLDAAARGFVTLSRPVILPQSRLTADCGPESLCAVIAFWGKTATVEEVSRRLRNPLLQGVFSTDIPPLARERGLKATLSEGNVDRLKRALDRGVPPIVMIDSGGGNRHFFVATAYSDLERAVICEDYGESKRLVGYDELDARWERAGRLLLELEPSTADADFHAGANLEASGQVEEAASLYRRALTAQPDHYDARVGLGNCLLHLGRHEEALAEYRRAREADPRDPRVANNLANLLVELKRDLPEAEKLAEDAVAKYRSALREAHREPQARAERDLAYALGTLGQARAAQGRHALAISAWKASYDHLPLTDADPRARRLLEIALSCRALSMPAEARKHLESASREARDHALRARIEEALNR